MDVVLNEVGDVVLTPEAMLVLADSGRLALLDRLRRSGSATVTGLAAAARVDEPTVEDQLGALAGVGLVTASDVPGGARRWQAVGKGIYIEIPADPAGQAAARKLTGVMLRQYEDLPRRWVEEDGPRLDLDWFQAAGMLNVRVVLTPAELRDVQARFEDVLRPYLNREPEQLPADGRQVRLLGYFLPRAAAQPA